MDPLEKWLKGKKVIVCMGSGGVGKTTLTAALALSAARRGLKVLALTVDPSQRLVNQMGIDAENPRVQKVPLEVGEGTFYTCVLNSQHIFDQFVLEHSTNRELAEKLMGNALYKQLSSTLSGSQEFTSLELLYSEYASGSFDLIVLDTPPTQHALDFLEAPKMLRALFDESVLRWFRSDRSFGGDKWYSRAFQFGTRKVLKALSVLTGEGFINSLVDFFQSVSGVQAAIAQRGQLFDQLLTDSATGFIAITGFDRNQFQEASDLKDHLDSLGMNLMGVVINRVFPFLQVPSEDIAHPKLQEELEDYQKLYAATQAELKDFLKHFSEESSVVNLPRRFLPSQELLDFSQLRELES